jgi:putative endonuclease
MDKSLQTFTVYVLYSDKHRKHYTGYTAYLELRLEQHFETATKGWTVRYRPWRLIFAKEFETKFEALSNQRYRRSDRIESFVPEEIKNLMNMM